MGGKTRSRAGAQRMISFVTWRCVSIQLVRKGLECILRNLDVVEGVDRLGQVFGRITVHPIATAPLLISLCLRRASRQHFLPSGRRGCRDCWHPPSPANVAAEQHVSISLTTLPSSRRRMRIVRRSCRATAIRLARDVARFERHDYFAEMQ